MARLDMNRATSESTNCLRFCSGMRSHHGLIALAPLDRDQVHHMIEEIAARRGLPQEVVEGVTERAGGVPLFVEEVTRLLLERGEHGGAQAIPPTLQQSLMARLDRLGEAKEVAQIGAVIGRDFSYPLLRAVSDLEEALCKPRWNGLPRPTSYWCRACRRKLTIVLSTRSSWTQPTKTCSRAGAKSCTAGLPWRCAIISSQAVRPSADARA